MSPQSVVHGRVLLGLGGNSSGPWGTPEATLRRAIEALGNRGVRVVAVSPCYRTAALGPSGQPPYVNAVALVETALPAPALLRLLKQIEVQAGRRGGKPWGSRTLDLDLLDYKGLVVNWSKLTSSAPPKPGARPLSLPHPQIAARAFVLRPLLDVAPGWRHPVTKESARDLWRNVSKGGQGRVLQRIA